MALRSPGKKTATSVPQTGKESALVHYVMPLSGKARLWVYGAHYEAVVAVWGILVVGIQIIEEDRHGVFAVGHAERFRPVEAPDIDTIDFGIEAGAGGRQEDTVAVRALYLIALLAVLSAPSPATFVAKLNYFLRCRHAPGRAELGGDDIVRSFQSGLTIAYELARSVIPDALFFSVILGVFRNKTPIVHALLHPLVACP